MKIVYIRLVGYIGIWNGLGLNDLELDLSKSKHKIILISGINGCGKSTLLRAISLLPDSSQDFTPNTSAMKQIRLVDNDNIYEITISSPVLKSSRGTTKCSIIKNGVELNPNGNVTSYKDIIFQEFELDSNFITLSRLSGDDRGLADKTPAERKKFMSFIVDSLETYNAIYKNLNKKSSIFKSYIGNLHNKIQGIGDEENLRNTVISLEARRDSLNKAIESLKNSIIESNTIITMNDPDGSMQQQYEIVENNLKICNQTMNTLHREFVSLCNTLEIEPKINSVCKFIDSKKALLEAHKQNIDVSNRNMLSLMEKRESLLSNMDSKKRKIDELSKGVDLNLSNTVASLRKKVEMEIEVLNSIGISDPDNTSKEELEYTFDTIRFIVDVVTTQLYSDITEDMINKTVYFSRSLLTKVESELNKQSEIINKLQDEAKDAQRDFETLSVLSNRPKGCKIDNCYFINTAYNLQKKKYSDISIEKHIENIAIELTNAVKYQSELSSEYETLMVIGQKRDILDRIRSTINMNKSILQKCDISRNLIETFETRILNLNSFNEFKDMDEMISKINTISIYKTDSNSLKALESSLVAQSNSESMIRELNNDIEELNKSLSNIDEELRKTDKEISSCSSIIKQLENNVERAIKAKEKGDDWLNWVAKQEEYQNKFDEIVRKSKTSLSILEKIGSMNAELQQLQSQLVPIDEQISSINGRLVMLESFKIEYKEYSDKYNMVDTLKKYSSPTSGIQTVFMSIYMNKTLELANQVLSMVFGGQYHILDYIINSNEFRIPFIGDGMTVDDISSGSTSQVCMMGLAMNLVLLYQASTRYNITRLDEIDGGLDTKNRLRFVDALYKIIDILKMDQLFIISHSIELELSNVDVIRLKMYNDSETRYEGNILYDFQNQTFK